MGNGWIGVDFDGTLAMYTHWEGPDKCGNPIPKMCNRVRQWLAEGKDVRIFTARAYVPGLITGLPAMLRAKRMDEARKSCIVIDEFCVREFGRVLPITCQKDFAMIELWDDRCVQVVPNTGERADGW